jgi:hypothetical protein
MDIGRAGIIPHEDFMTNDEAKRITRLDKYETLSEFEYKGIFSVE